MSFAKYILFLLCAVLAGMLLFPACGDDDDNGDGGDVDTDTDTDTDSDADKGEGEACTIMIASAIPAPGVCKKTDATCEGGFSSALPAEAGATQNCAEGLDCCTDTTQCEGLRPAVEPALSVIPECTPETGEGVCEQEGIFKFKVGCPPEKPVCCLTPVGDAGPDASE